MVARKAEASITGPMDSGRHIAADPEDAVAARMDNIADMRTEDKWRRSGDFRSKWRTWVNVKISRGLRATGKIFFVWRGRRLHHA